MLDSASAEHLTDFAPNSFVTHQSVLSTELEQRLRPEPQYRTGLGTSRLHLSVTQPLDLVQVSPCDAVRRRSASWTGMDVEIVEANRRGRIDYRYCGPLHMLVVHERGARQAGCTIVDGLPPSTQQDFSRHFLFVPAGHAYHDWHEPRTLSRTVFFLFKPPQHTLSPELGFANSLLVPRLFIKDNALIDTALKLSTLIESDRTDHRHYLEALGTVLLHEVARSSQAKKDYETHINGGLAAWQRRKAVAYIEQHLAEPISLAALAQMVGLSPCYFCRAFRQSFGVPPQRYQLSQRIERAKTLLAKHAASVTDVSASVGYNDTSAFCTAFRRLTGLTPSAYRRSIS